VTDRPTDRPTDHATRSVRIGCICVCNTAMRPNNISHRSADLLSCCVVIVYYENRYGVACWSWKMKNATAVPQKSERTRAVPINAERFL